jgi:hypothetical protein
MSWGSLTEENSCVLKKISDVENLVSSYEGGETSNKIREAYIW